jgi:hypothetical protein
VDIQAHESCAESREHPAALARECQQQANEHARPVVLHCAYGDRHTFYPQPNDIYDRYYRRTL